MPSSPKRAPLDLISSSAYLAIWDEYAKAALKGIYAFHGAANSASASSAAQHAAEAADALMIQRQERAQGHIDQAEADKAAKSKKGDAK